MPDRSRELYDSLTKNDSTTNVESIKKLIGQPEDVHFDCKEWPASDDDAQKPLAKAACGLTNAEGGVLLIGMKARAMSKDEPDLVDSAAPVANTSAVKSKLLDLIGKLVEPGIEGIEASEVNEPESSKSGFVVVYIPPSEGSPRRSRKDWKFYLRIGSGTFPMEYFQIEERFGKRPRPRLELYLEPDVFHRHPYGVDQPVRSFVLGINNLGAGIAKFPSIRYLRSCGLMVFRGIDGKDGYGIPPRASDSEWIIFRGGVDEVIYPGELRKITKLLQPGTQESSDIWNFRTITFQCEISCEGISTTTVEKNIPGESKTWP